jgi:hypothetical protein
MPYYPPLTTPPGWKAYAATGTADPYAGTTFAQLGQAFEINHGSDASPVTTGGPTIRFSRVENLPAATLGGSGTNLTNEGNATVVILATGAGTGTAGDNMQTCGLFVGANATGAGTWDAVGINCVGRVSGSSTRRATAAYLEGRMDVSGSKIGAVEIRGFNASTVNDAADSAYTTTGACATFGLWISSATATTANPVLGAAIQIGRGGSQGQWGVGVGFCTTGPTVNDIRSDSSATTGILMNGTYSTATIATAQASGLIGFGTVAPSAGVVHIAGAPAQTTTGLPADQTLLVADYQALSTGTGGTLGLGGWTDTAKTVLRAFGRIEGRKTNATSGNTTGYLTLCAHLNGTGMVEMVRVDGLAGVTIGKTTAQKIGLWNVTPVVQPATTGTATGFTAGGGTTATHTSTFTGNTGSAAYTVGDIVLALKQVGILAA